MSWSVHVFFTMDGGCNTAELKVLVFFVLSKNFFSEKKRRSLDFCLRANDAIKRDLILIISTYHCGKILFVPMNSINQCHEQMYYCQA